MRSPCLRPWALALVLALTAPLLACGGDEPDGVAPGDGAAPPSTSADEPASDAGPLGDWVSTEVLDGGQATPAFEGTHVTVEISATEVRARAACNHLGVPIDIDGDRLVATGPGGGTEMGCPPTQQAQDEWLLALLSAGPTWQRDGGELVLTAGERELRLVDEAEAGPDRPFTGTRWVVDAVIQGESASSLPTGAQADLTFADDGTFAGFDGCNSISGPYLLEAGTLRFGDVTTTLRACGEAETQVAEAVGEVLAQALQVTVDGDVLTLQAPGGPGLVLRATD